MRRTNRVESIFDRHQRSLKISGFLGLPGPVKSAAARKGTCSLGPPLPDHRDKDGIGGRNEMSLLPSSSISPPTGSLPSNYSLLNLFNASFGDLALAPLPPIGNSTSAKKERDLKRRRVSESRRQRTPMSCDRCKSRKIKVRIKARRLLCAIC